MEKYLKTCTYLILLGVLSFFLFKSQDRLSRQNLLHTKTNKKILDGTSSMAPLIHHQPLSVSTVFLGHKRLYVDYLYLWLLQYLLPHKGILLESEETLLTRTHSVLKWQPPMESIYLLSCHLLGLEKKKHKNCLPILTKGMEAAPYSWRIPLMLAYIYGFLEDDRLKASKYYKISSEKKGAPAFTQSLALKLQENKNLSLKDKLRIFESIRKKDYLQ